MSSYSWNTPGLHCGSAFHPHPQSRVSLCGLCKSSVMSQWLWETRKSGVFICLWDFFSRDCVCVCVCVCSVVSNSTDCSLPGSFVHGILQARILEWVAIPFSRGSSQPRDWTQVSCIAGRFFTIWATRTSSYAKYVFSFNLLSPDEMDLAIFI